MRVIDLLTPEQKAHLYSAKSVARRTSGRPTTADEKAANCAYAKARFQLNPEHIRAVQRARVAANPGKNAAWQRAWKGKTEARAKKHGTTMTHLRDLLSAQSDACANPGCQCALTIEAACVDHDHRCCSGAGSCGRCIRGLLCQRCNRLLGQAHDDTGVLLGAITYLLTTPKVKP
jgi:recombination endonuclease VII